MHRGITCTLAALTAAGCIRSVDNVPTDEGGFIRGTVVARSTDTGLFEPVVGARVELVGGSVGRTTDARGQFELRRLPLAVHQVDVTLRAAGGAAPRALRTSAIRLEAPGQDVDLGELRLGALSDLEGSVVLLDDPNPAAAVGTIVVLASTPFTAVVGRDGRFTFRSIPPGPYDVVAYREGYGAKSVDGVLLQGGIALTAPDIELDREAPSGPVEVRGRVDVVDANDDDVRTTFISETTTASAPPSAYMATPTNAMGEFALTLPVGVYRVRFARADIRPSELRNVVVTASGAVGLDPVYLGLAAPNDMDGDGIADAEDPDPDGDGCVDDAFGDDPLRCFDADMDGLADSEDPDDDGDGLVDFEETSLGVDGWLTDPFEWSTDDDPFDDLEDNCPLLPSAVQWPDTNGNGIGDACEEGAEGTTPTGDPPTVTGFGPNPAGVGETVEVFGTSFAPGAETFVSFGGGLAPAVSVEPDLVVARVPEEARSGVLRVLNGLRIATATATFALIPPPIIRYFQPTSVRPGERVALYGLRFEDLAGGVAPTVTVSGNATDPAACDPVQISDAMLVGLEVVCFRPPPGSVGGPVRLVAPHGEATSASSLIIQSGPSIAFFTINPVAEGGTTTIVGDGFSLDGLVGNVTVDLPGAPGVMVMPTGDASIPLTVPAGATTGRVTLHHPSGTVMSAAPLQIANGVPAIVDFDPPVVERGETLTILGAELQDVETVTFTGGATAMYVDRTASQVTVVVPAGAQPGPVTVASATQTSPPSGRRLVLMTRTMNTPTLANALLAGIAISPADEIMLWSTAGANPPNTVFSLDATTLQPTSITMGAVSVSNPSQIIGSRGGARGVIEANFPRRLVLIDIPSGSVVGPSSGCTDAGISGNDVVFDATNDNLYALPSGTGSRNSLFRMDLSTGVCTHLLEDVMPDLRGIGLLGNALIISDLSGRLAKVDLTTHAWSPYFGTLNTVTPPDVTMVHYTGAPDRVFGFSSGISSELAVLPINAGPRSEVGNVNSSGSGELSRNTRWFMRGTLLYDLAEPRIARRDIPISPYRGIVSTSDPATFVVRDTQNTPTFYRFEIEE